MFHNISVFVFKLNYPPLKMISDSFIPQIPISIVFFEGENFFVVLPKKALRYQLPGQRRDASKAVKTFFFLLGA